MFDWSIALGLLLVFIIILLLTRYVSLGSIIAALLFPITAALFGRDIKTLVFSGIIAVLVIIKHHKNIKRLLDGTEPRLTLKKSK